MKSAITIVNEVTQRMNNASTVVSLYGSTDPNAIQLLQLLTDTLEELRAARCWVEQKRKYSLTTTTATQYALPADFYSMLLGTPYNQGTDRTLIGPISDESFGYHLYGAGGATSEYSFRFFGNSLSGQIEVYPTPTAGITLSFEYLTRNLFLPVGWTEAVYTAYETLSADTDRVLFDADLVKLGLRAKYWEEKGGDYQAAKEEFEKKIENAVAKMQGPRKGSFAQRDDFPRYQTQYKGWSI